MMQQIKENFSINFSIPAFIFWLAVGLLFPVVAGSLHGVEWFKVIAFFFAATGLGLFSLDRVKFTAVIPAFIRMGIALVTGGTLIQLLFALFPYTQLVYVLDAIVLLLIVLSRGFSLRTDTAGVVSLAPMLVLLLYGEESLLATSHIFRSFRDDYFFYEAIVVSLAKTHSIFDSAFHTGAPVNYASLPFFTPAALSYATGISGHICYSAIYVPVLKTLSFSVVAASAVQAYRYFRPAATISWKHYLVAALAVLLLAPLHPQYIAKLDYTKFIFSGEGYILPLTSMGFAMAAMLFGLANFFVFSAERKTVADLVFFVLVVGAIAACKQTFFYPVIVFYGLFALFIAITTKKIALLWQTALAGVSGIVFTKIFTGNDGGMVKPVFTTDSAYLHYFKLYAQKFHLPGTTNAAILLFSVVILLWLGLKLLLFGAGLRDKATGVRPFILACVMCILLFMLPGWLMGINYLDEQKNIVAHGTIDTMQFASNGMFISTFAGITCLLLLGSRLQNKKKLAFQILVGGWFVLAGISLVSSLLPKPELMTNSWEDEVRKDFADQKPKLMVMRATEGFSGQSLVANEVQPWYICSRRCDFWGSYLFTLKPNYRNRMMDRLYDDPSAARSVKDSLVAAGVDVIVATPADSTAINRLVAEHILSKPEGSKWIYRLNKN